MKILSDSSTYGRAHSNYFEKKGVGMGKGPPKKGVATLRKPKWYKISGRQRSGGDNLIGRIMRQKVVNMSRFHMQEPL